jgi:hypothetical protein
MVARALPEPGPVRRFNGPSQSTMTREEPDMRKRFVTTVAADRIDGRWDASEDEGRTWRKDFDLIFEWSGER